MAQLSGHKNIVGLHGVVTAGAPAILLVSYCEHGSLLSQLIARAERDDAFSVVAKLTFGVEICQGMAYLAEKNVVHRDLAARNILVDVDWQVKIADFGLSREIADRKNPSPGDTGGSTDGEEGQSRRTSNISSAYYRSGGGLLAVRWTALEAMQDLFFSQASDVWSFGIVMSEILCNGQQPYPGLDNQQLLHFLERGNRMTQQDLGHGCSNELYAILMRCWYAQPCYGSAWLQPLLRPECHAMQCPRTHTMQCTRTYALIRPVGRGASGGRCTGVGMCAGHAGSYCIRGNGLLWVCNASVGALVQRTASMNHVLSQHRHGHHHEGWERGSVHTERQNHEHGVRQQWACIHQTRSSIANTSCNVVCHFVSFFLLPGTFDFVATNRSADPEQRPTFVALTAELRELITLGEMCELARVLHNMFVPVTPSLFASPLEIHTQWHTTIRHGPCVCTFAHTCA